MIKIEDLLYATIRISVEKQDGKDSSATGFFYKLKDDDLFPLLICNRHLMENAQKAHCYFHIANEEDKPTNDEFVLNIDNILHICSFDDNKENDLCIIKTEALFKHFEQTNVHIYYKYFLNLMIPTDNDINSFQAIEEVFLIGYPSNLYDKYNKLPIIRKGITATQYKLDYNGTKTFLIDASIYPGSSGSPVICFKNEKILLLGIQKKVHLHNFLWSSDDISLQINMPNGLGLITKSIVLPKL